MDSDYAVIGARIAVLERRVRRLKVALAACAVLALAVSGFAGASAQQYALHFQNAYGSVKLASDGLSFYDRRAALRMKIFTDETGRPIVQMIDSAKVPRVMYGLQPSGNPRFAFNDKSGTERLYVGLTTEQTGLVRTFTRSEKIQSSLEDTFLRIRDTSGIEQLVIGVSSANSPVLKMFDTSSTNRLYAGVYSDGNSGFASYSTTGSAVWSSP